MSRLTNRYAAHRAHQSLEWIIRHVSARPDTREVRDRLLGELDDVEAFILRIMGATPLPDDPLASPQALHTLDQTLP